VRSTGLSVCCRISEFVTGKSLSQSPASLSSTSLNSSAIRNAWVRVYNKYSRLYKRSAFIHHFENEGIEKTDLEEASENLLALIKDYEEVEKE
jgi:tubulin alpha